VVLVGPHDVLHPLAVHVEVGVAHGGFVHPVAGAFEFVGKTGVHHGPGLGFEKLHQVAHLEAEVLEVGQVRRLPVVGPGGPLKQGQLGGHGGHGRFFQQGLA